MRNVSDEIWSDDWFSDQEPIGKLIWIGIISKVADDQGRFRHNAELVKSLLFPMSKNPSSDEIDLWLTFFAADKKLLSYEANGKKYLQVINWWKYQASSNWMSASQHPAPEGWTDCWRYHGKGNALVQSPNWLTREAGFLSLSSKLPSKLDSNDGSNDVNGDSEVNGDGEEEREDKTATLKTSSPAASAAAKNQYFTSAGQSQAHNILLQAAQLAAIPSGEIGRIETVCSLVSMYGDKAALEMLREARNAWVKTPKKHGGGCYSPTNFGWVDWAMSALAGVKPWEKQTTPSKQKDYDYDALRKKAASLLSATGAPT